MHFENQVVLVSGAGRGIGKEIALTFAREGADNRLRRRQRGNGSGDSQ
jgi:NAD(P)-dependent dehydrogenase (short-subunit alcohol dehydrogenase family)